MPLRRAPPTAKGLTPAASASHIKTANARFAGAHMMPSPGGIWMTRFDHAARFSVAFEATLSVNTAPPVTKGNCFAPVRRRHVFAAG